MGMYVVLCSKCGSSVTVNSKKQTYRCKKCGYEWSFRSEIDKAKSDPIVQDRIRRRKGYSSRKVVEHGKR